MRVTRLQIENILSIKSATIEFPRSGLMLVDGWNHDTESANGAGKSSIFTALSWGLFGEYPRGVSVTGIVRNGARKSRVVVEAEIMGGQVLKVERCRPSQNRFFKDDLEIAEPEFQRLLGVTYEQFLLGQYFAQGLGQRFLDLNDSGRKDLILTLMRAQSFAAAKIILDGQAKVLAHQITDFTSKVSSNSAKIEAYEEYLASDQELKQQEVSLKDSIKAHIEAAKSMTRPSDERLKALLEEQASIRNTLNEILSLKGTGTALRQQLKELEAQPEPVDDHDGQCPSCETKIDVVRGVFVKHDHASFKKKLQEWKQLNASKQDALISKISKIEKELVQEQSLKDALAATQNTIKDISVDIDSFDARYAELRNKTNEKIKKLEEVKQLIAKNNEIRNKISVLREELAVANLKIESLSKELELFKSASQIVSPTGVPAYIMDTVVDAFNDKVGQYLQSIWPNASYTLNTFKENKSGTTTAKMSDVLTIDGTPYSIGALSGGERKCLSIAVDFAVLDVISQYTGAILSPIIMDEPFDHLDASNRSRAIDLLKELAQDRLIVVVDHASESKSLFDKVVMVSRRNGVSSIA